MFSVSVAVLVWVAWFWVDVAVSFKVILLVFRVGVCGLLLIVGSLFV